MCPGNGGVICDKSAAVIMTIGKFAKYHDVP
jgi:hypothetical protein